MPTPSNPADSRPGQYRKLQWGPPPVTVMVPGPAGQLLRVPQGVPMDEAAADVATDPFLAAFLATGMRPPTVPGAANAKEECIALLQAAAEIEQALMVQYLYAWFTSGDDEFQPRQGNFLAIAIQEMGHLFSVQNLLRALGQPVYLDLPDSSSSTAQDTHPFPLHLGPVSRKLLAQYVTAESPLLGTITDLDQRELAARAAQDAMLDVRHVGILFLKLYWLAQPSKVKFGPWNPPLAEAWEAVLGDRHLVNSALEVGAQRSWNTTWDVPMDNQDFLDLSAEKKLFVARLTGDGTVPWSEQMCRLFYSIGTQGEGYSSDPAHAGHAHRSHFELFLDLYKNWPTGAEPAGIIQTVPNPWISSDGSASQDAVLEASRLTDPAAVILAKALNLRYERILLLIALTFTEEAMAPNNLMTVIRTQAVGLEMRNHLVTITNALLKRPAKEGGAADALRAGPPFRAHSVPTDYSGIRARLIAIKQETEALAWPGGTRLVNTVTVDEALLARLPT